MPILYPTETIYALGVNGFDADELQKLYVLKGRDEGKPVSLLVRSVEDIERYAVLSPRARRIAERFLPGPLTLVVRAREDAPRPPVAPDGTLSFRISSDPIAQQLIHELTMDEPFALTATSANVSGEPTLATVPEIIAQFKAVGRNLYHTVNRMIDDGPRSGQSSTVVRIIGDEMTIIRVGAVSETDLLQA